MLGITNVRIREFEGRDKFKGFISIGLGNYFVVEDLKLMANDNGELWIALPAMPKKDGSYKDIFYPASPEIKNEFQNFIIGVYNKEIEIEQKDYDLEEIITDVKIRVMENMDKLKGFVTLTLFNQFVVENLKVMESYKGLWVAMPSVRKKDGNYKDIFFPITKESRQALMDKVLDVYNKKVGTSEEKEQQIDALASGPDFSSTPAINTGLDDDDDDGLL